MTAPLALVMGCGFMMVRKRGKLPGHTIPLTYDLEYGTDTIEVQDDFVHAGQRVIVLDDVLATGGTMAAAIQLLRRPAPTYGAPPASSSSPSSKAASAWTCHSALS